MAHSQTPFMLPSSDPSASPEAISRNSAPKGLENSLASQQHTTQLGLRFVFLSPPNKAFKSVKPKVSVKAKN